METNQKLNTVCITNPSDNDTIELLGPFIDRVEELFNKFDIKVTFTSFDNEIVVFTLLIPTLPEIEYTYDFNLDPQDNFIKFKETFISYCQDFKSVYDKLIYIKDTF